MLTEDGVGIPSAVVALHSHDLDIVSRADLEWRGATDEAGSVEVPDHVLSRWRDNPDLVLAAHADGFVPGRFERRGGDLRLLPAAPLTITIRDMQDRPVADVGIAVCRTALRRGWSEQLPALPGCSGAAIHVVRTDFDGAARFGELAQGAYVFELDPLDWIIVEGAEARIDVEASGDTHRALKVARAMGAAVRIEGGQSPRIEFGEEVDLFSPEHAPWATAELRVSLANRFPGALPVVMLCRDQLNAAAIVTAHGKASAAGCGPKFVEVPMQDPHTIQAPLVVSLVADVDPGEGRVFVRARVPSGGDIPGIDVLLVNTESGNAESILNAATSQVCTVPAGTYRIQLAMPQPGLPSILARDVLIEPGKQREVLVDLPRAMTRVELNVSRWARRDTERGAGESHARVGRNRVSQHAPGVHSRPRAVWLDQVSHACLRSAGRGA